MPEMARNGTVAHRGEFDEKTAADTASRLEEALKKVARLEADLTYHREMITHALATLIRVDRMPALHFLNGCFRLRTLILPSGSWRSRALVRLIRSVQQGFRAAAAPFGKKRFVSINQGYARWQAKHEPQPVDLQFQQRAQFTREPRIGLLVALTDAPQRFLQPMLQSVVQQTYARWELFLVVAPPGRTSVDTILPQTPYLDQRIHLLNAPPGLGLSEFYNQALAACPTEFVALLQGDDTLAPFALYEIVQTLNRYPDADLIYSDEDCLAMPAGQRTDPLFKPDWSPDTLRSHNYVGDLCVVSRALVERVGGFRSGFDACLAYDLLLRVTEQARRVVHVPQILYHRRRRERTRTDAESDSDTAATIRVALAQHLGRLGRAGKVEVGIRPGTFRVTYPLPSHPLVSIIIPTRDHVDVLRRCIRSLDRSTYPHVEIILVENQSVQPETFLYYRELVRRPEVRILNRAESFNFAALNNDAVAHARGETLLFLNNDVEVINPDWLERMLEHAMRPEVGAVGAKLYFPDDTIQHAGMIVGMNQGAGHYHRFFPRASAGYGSRLACIQNLSALTAACLMMRRQVFQEVEGFDPMFPLEYNDTDLCLKIREQGYGILWTPHAELYHHESLTRGLDPTPDKVALHQYEMLCFQRKWREVLDRGDPYYNPNLALDREDCSLKI